MVLLALAVLAGAQVWLARVVSEGGPQRWADLPGGVPTSLYLPGEGPSWPPPPPPPPDERPPVLVLLHGHTGDQVGMSGLALSIANAGFAVLTLDLRGHGRNRRPFNEEAGVPEQFDLEIRAALEYLRRSPDVDGARIALAGHSMGAGAVLEYATRDTAIDAAIMISGGWEMSGPHRPSNAFFLYAENELGGIPESVNMLAARIARQRVPPDRTLGDVETATGVRVHVVPGANHGSIIRSDETVREIVAWLDGAWGLDRNIAPGYEDPRELPSQVALAAFAIVLLGLGSVAGRLAARFEPSSPPPEHSFAHLVPIAGASFLVLPLFALWFPGVLLGTSEADRGVTYLAIVGIVLLVGLGLSGALRERVGVPSAAAVRGSLLVGAAAVLAGYVLLTPWAVTLRGLSLTPERAVVALWIAAALSPFALAFHLLAAGGSTLRSLALRVAARGIVVAALAAGLVLDFFYFPSRMFTVVLAVNAIWLELVFVPYYARTRNVLSATAIEALWLGWQLAVVLPISL